LSTGNPNDEVSFATQPIIGTVSAVDRWWSAFSARNFVYE